MTLWGGHANRDKCWPEARRQYDLVVLDHDGPLAQVARGTGEQAVHATGGLKRWPEARHQYDLAVLDHDGPLAQVARGKEQAMQRFGLERILQAELSTPDPDLISPIKVGGGWAPPGPDLISPIKGGGGWAPAACDPSKLKSVSKESCYTEHDL